MNSGLFHPAIHSWFSETFGNPTEIQRQAWPEIKKGNHVLISAPTGSGKTLAAFLTAINSLVEQGVTGFLPHETQVVYVSPLKALSNDIEINLRAPLKGVRQKLDEMGLADPGIRVKVRTGDTPPSERTEMTKKPPHIVVTTPESLYLLLTSKGGRNMLRTVRTVIVDEIHAVMGSKRGSHLTLSLERLQRLVGGKLTRIGISATQKPIERVAQYLTGVGRQETRSKIKETSKISNPKLQTPNSHNLRAPESRKWKEEAIETTSPTPQATNESGCTIINIGHKRDMDLKIEIPNSPLTAVMANEVWDEVYTKLENYIKEHKTTLIFVNTRRLAERMSHNLQQSLGEEVVAAHHGSMAHKQRHIAEQKLKHGELKALVATASLELGIDIGSIDLVIQIGSTKNMATLLQRVGRSGHSLHGLPKGRLFPLTLDDLIECTALVHSVRLGELDRIVMPEKPIDILAQQIVAEVGNEEYLEDDLFDMFSRAYPYRNMSRKEFDDIITMLADGYSVRNGLRARYIHHDMVNQRLRGRRGAQLTALISGGAIPDMFDYEVVLEPDGTRLGTINEDFAIESMPGDIFQLGNNSWQILRVEQGTVRVSDANGQPPTMPFWLGEAPGRTTELSESVSQLRQTISSMVDVNAIPPMVVKSEVNLSEPLKQETRDKKQETNEAPNDKSKNTSPASPVIASHDLSRGEAIPTISTLNHGIASVVPNGSGLLRNDSMWMESALNWLQSETGITVEAAEQIVSYLASAKAALGELPTRDRLIMERFFDEGGDMHLVIHSTYGSRMNRAWGLALRKKFCRKFNFELQAAANEDAIIISLGTTHSFPLQEVYHYLNAKTVRDILIQAMFDAPVFGTRWRWNATRALAILRSRGGKRTPPAIQRMHSEDLLAVVFPDQLACLENIQGDREIPDHPLVNQTIDDCLNEAMEIEQLEKLLDRIQNGELELIAKDLTEASPLAHEIINARPYAFLDDAPLEERRTQAVRSRRWIDPAEAKNLGKLDEGAIEAVRAEAWPEPRDLDELHDALVLLGYITSEEAKKNKWEESLKELVKVHRVTTFTRPSLRGSPHDIRTDEAIPHISAHDGGIASIASLSRNDSLVLWVAAERLPYLHLIFPNGITESQLRLPERIIQQTENLTREKALVELIRCRLSGLGPAWQSRFVSELGLDPTDVEVALVSLENEGYVFRGTFTTPTTSSRHAELVLPREGGVSASETLKQAEGHDAPSDTEWCERRLLARIHRYTLESLRKEIQPVTAADFMNFLFSWHGIAGEKLEGPDALQKVLLQLEGYETQAAAWEADILSARLKDYSHEWLDQLCWSGRIMWGRLRPNGSGSTPIKTTPVSLFTRHRHEFWLSVAANGKHKPTGIALQVYDVLKEKGASFFDEILVHTRLLPVQVEEALATLVGYGLVTSDSYTGLRALLVSGKYRTERRTKKNAFTMDMAGRWTLLPAVIASEAERSAAIPQEQLHTIAKILLNRYGVMFRRLADREAMAPAWRDLVRAYRLLEARGEIRGGRFVEGFYGEQYALPEAIPLLRKARSSSSLSLGEPVPIISSGGRGEASLSGGEGQSEALVSISASDPLNLVGIITPDVKVTAHYKNRLLFQYGKLIASKEGDSISFHVKPTDERQEWRWKNALVKRVISPRLRAYLGKGVAK